MTTLEAIGLYGKPVEPNVSGWQREVLPPRLPVRCPPPFYPLQTYGEYWDEMEAGDRWALGALKKEADNYLAALHHPFPEGSRRRVGFNLNRETPFHRDKHADWGVLFSFGTRPGFIAVAECKTVYELQHGSRLALDLRSPHGSYVSGEGWRLNIVFFSVRES